MGHNFGIGTTGSKVILELQWEGIRNQQARFTPEGWIQLFQTSSSAKFLNSEKQPLSTEKSEIRDPITFDRKPESGSLKLALGVYGHRTCLSNLSSIRPVVVEI